MAEQSSAAVAVRAFVMLGCLVAIPLVALFGNALPEAMDQLAGTWWAPPSMAVSGETAEEAPLFEPLLRGPSPRVQEDSPAPAWPAQMSPGPAAGRTACDVDERGVLPASYEAPVDFPPDRQPLSNAISSLGHGAPAGSVPPERAVSQPPDSFQTIHQRLKQLGSTYVLLESWGDGQEQFRFYCKIAVAGNPHYTYRFEATSPDPLVAMARVLQQVESWHAARYGN